MTFCRGKKEKYMEIVYIFVQNQNGFGDEAAHIYAQSENF